MAGNVGAMAASQVSFFADCLLLAVAGRGSAAVPCCRSELDPAYLQLLLLRQP